jgi:4-hydroxy-3-methylbut-2-en-1-yl diphosphate reductase
LCACQLEISVAVDWFLVTIVPELNMKILLARPRGFCAGVEMAINTLERTLRLYSRPIYAFHQIVHNRTVVKQFEDLGVIFVDNIMSVPRGGTVVFSAHGVSPAVRRLAAARDCKIIDATCPLVTKVHNEVRAFVRRGLRVVLIGHPGHDEVEGTLGEAPDSVTVVQTIEDIERLPFPGESQIGYVTQTTLSVDDAQHLIAALRKRFPSIVGPPKEDICYATQNRQDAVKLAAAKADLALVIGSENSSNSQRLVDIARGVGVPAYLIEGPEAIKLHWLANVSTLLLTAGASVPESLVTNTIDWFREMSGVTVEETEGPPELVRFAIPKAVSGRENRCWNAEHF